MVFEIEEKLLDQNFDDNSKHANQFREIYGFLHKNSTHYQTIIKLFSTIFYVNNELRSGFSKLITAMVSNKFKTFCMYLDMGYDPDALGLFCNDLTLSSLKATIILGKSEYIVKLLEKGATPDAPRLALLFYLPHLQRINRAGIGGLFPKGKKLSSEAEDYYAGLKKMSLLPDLATVVNLKKFNTIASFLPHTSFLNLAVAMGQCIILKGINKRLIHHSTAPGIFACASRDEADNLTNQIHTPLGESSNVALLFYLEDSKLVQELGHIRHMMDYFKEQCQKYPNKLPMLITQAEQMARLIPTEEDIFYLTCQILLAELIPENEFNTRYRQQVMQMCCYYGKCMKQGGLSEYAHILYRDAVLLAKFDEKLQATHMYAHAQKKYQETVAHAAPQQSRYSPSLKFVIDSTDQNSVDSLFSQLDYKPH